MSCVYDMTCSIIYVCQIFIHAHILVEVIVSWHCRPTFARKVNEILCSQPKHKFPHLSFRPILLLFLLHLRAILFMYHFDDATSLFFHVSFSVSAFMWRYPMVFLSLITNSYFSFTFITLCVGIDLNVWTNSKNTQPLCNCILITD